MLKVCYIVLFLCRFRFTTRLMVCEGMLTLKVDVVISNLVVWF